jgi:hypothetical protein
MDDVLAVMPRAGRMMVGIELELIGRWTGTGRVTETEMVISWELLNLSLHTHINGHTAPSRTRPRPSANTGTGTGVTVTSARFTTHHPLQSPHISKLVFNITPRRTAPRMSFVMAGEAVPAMSTLIPPIPLSAIGIGAGVGLGATMLTNLQLTFECANRTRNVFYEPPPIGHENNIGNVVRKRSFQQISDPEPGHLLAFDQSWKLVDFIDDNDMDIGCGDVG